MPIFKNHKRLGWGVVIAAIVLGFFFLQWMRPSPIRPHVVWLPPPALAAQPKPGWMQKIVYQYRALKWKLFGPGRTITMDFKYLSAPASLNLSRLNLPPLAFAGSNGICAWIPEARESQAIQTVLRESPGAKMINQPRVSCGNGVQCAMSSGTIAVINGATQNLGFGLECTPRQERGGLQARLEMCFTEAALAVNSIPAQNSIRTNLAFACQMQIPPGHDGLIIQNPSQAVGDQYLIVFIHAASTP
jgi:hypothetical protein